LPSNRSDAGPDAAPARLLTLHHRGEILLAFFWFLTGMLTALGALILILPWLRKVPLLGPLPPASWQVALSIFVVVAAGLGVYQWLGQKDLSHSRASAVDRGFREALGAFNTEPTPANTAPSGAGPMSGAIAALESRLAKGGGSAEDWELLAKSYEFLGRPDEAASARARKLPPLAASDGEPAGPAAMAPPPVAPTLSAESLQLLAKASSARQNKQMKQAAAIYTQLAARGQMNADSWADYADAVASVQGGKIAGEPESYIAKSLALNPQHPKALWLKASADQEAGRYAAAVAAWQQLQAVLPADSADAKIVAANLQQDLKLAGAAPAVASAMTVSGEISLSSALSAKVTSGATLFIVAKSIDSPGAPVAVLRAKVGAWPLKFTLDDSQSMLPGRNLSSAGRVTIEARISRSGQPLPAAGDLQGSSGIVNPADHQPLKILIDREIT
jgi:cytochrome c-type biogenesis protein CcmH/NrfG